jgi:hypothetical protein
MAWTEFELHEKRSTVMLQHEMPMSDGDFDLTVSTEWFSIMNDADGKDLMLECVLKISLKDGKVDYTLVAPILWPTGPQTDC